LGFYFFKLYLKLKYWILLVKQEFRICIQFLNLLQTPSLKTLFLFGVSEAFCKNESMELVAVPVLLTVYFYLKDCIFLQFFFLGSDPLNACSVTILESHLVLETIPRFILTPSATVYLFFVAKINNIKLHLFIPFKILCIF